MSWDFLGSKAPLNSISPLSRPTRGLPHAPEARIGGIASNSASVSLHALMAELMSGTQLNRWPASNDARTILQSGLGLGTIGR